MIEPPNVEHTLASLGQIISGIQWWRFDLDEFPNQKHIWISLPLGAEVSCGKPSLLPSNSHFLGRLNILQCGADCCIQGVRVAPSQPGQMLCLEIRNSNDPRNSEIIWYDMNRPPTIISPSGAEKKIVDISRPVQLIQRSRIWGWLSGLEVPSTQPRLISHECFLIPVNFTNRDDIAVLISRNSGAPITCTPSPLPQKLIIMNPQTNDLYSIHPKLLNISQTCLSPFEVSYIN